MFVTYTYICVHMDFYSIGHTRVSSDTFICIKGMWCHSENEVSLQNFVCWLMMALLGEFSLFLD